jgi:hypothetical protein
MNSTYLSSLSNDVRSKILYPNNQNSSFTIALSKDLYKGDFKHWSIALLNISLPSSTPNILKEENFIRVFSHEESFENDPISQYEIIIPVGKYQNMEDIITNIQAKLSNHANLKITLYEKLRIAFHNKSDRNITILMPTSLALIFGFITSVSLNSKTYELRVPIAQEIYGKFDANLKMSAHLYCKLLCEQVNPTFFGGSAEQVLRFLPVSGLNIGRNTFHEFY